MAPRGEQNTLGGSSAWHATANHAECAMNYEWNPGAYARDRLTDYNLHCRVSLLRVHVRNSNKICSSGTRCALKKFDILSEEASWAYIGRFMMPDPGNTVSSNTSLPYCCTVVLFLRLINSTLPSELWPSSIRDIHIQLGRKWNPLRGTNRCIRGGSSRDERWRSNGAILSRPERSSEPDHLRDHCW